MGAIMYIGIYKTLVVKRRVESLKVYRNFLLKLETEISFASRAIEEIIGGCNNEFSNCIQFYLLKMKLPNAYENACVEYFTDKEDRLFAKLFMNNLGRYNVEKQVEHINIHINELQEKIEMQEILLLEKGRVNIIFYAFLGIAVALVLV